MSARPIVKTEYLTDLNPMTENVTGQRIGRLVALGPIERIKTAQKNTKLIWEWQCDCGNRLHSCAWDVKKMQTRGSEASCGCARIQATVPPLKTPVTFLRVPPGAKTLVRHRYGRLIVLGLVGIKYYGQKNHLTKTYQWLCQCECGKVTTVFGSNLRKNTRSCGCQSGRRKNDQPKIRVVRQWDGKTYIKLGKLAHDLTGQTFGRLTALGPVKAMRSDNNSTDIMWLCQCACGNKHEARAGMLRMGHTTSCGCFNRHKLTARAKPKHEQPQAHKLPDMLRWKAQRTYWLSDDEPERECAKAT